MIELKAKFDAIEQRDHERSDVEAKKLEEERKFLNT